jgi:long-chain acyl-CoA synthetase
LLYKGEKIAVSEENRRQIDLAEIEKRLLSISDFQKEVAVIRKEDQLFAIIYPNFDLLKKANIINIEEELKWYGVELYNIDAQQGKKIKGYEIVTRPLSLQAAGLEKHESEPDDEVYRILKKYLQGVSAYPVFPSSHLGLDLGLDSLEYVMLFEFIEKSFGVHLDEKMFSGLMVMGDLYRWVKAHSEKSTVSEVSWSGVLKERSREKLVYSPWIMMVWKYALLAFFKPYFRLKATGIQNLPEAPFIIAPTHYSMLDGFIVLATLPPPVLKKSFFLAYEGEFGKDYLRPIARHSQMLLIDIDKHLKRSLLTTAEPLKESQNLVIFPENARSRDGRLLKFKRFFAILSKELDVPIVPAVIHGTFEALPAGKLFPKRKNITIKYLEPVYPEDGMGYNELSDCVRNIISAELSDLESQQ